MRIYHDTLYCLAFKKCSECITNEDHFLKLCLKISSIVEYLSKIKKCWYRTFFRCQSGLIKVWYVVWEKAWWYMVCCSEHLILKSICGDLLKHGTVIYPEIFDDISLRVYSNSPCSRYSFIPQWGSWRGRSLSQLPPGNRQSTTWISRQLT